jgi:hypothetical protein
MITNPTATMSGRGGDTANDVAADWRGQNAADDQSDGGV